MRIAILCLITIFIIIGYIIQESFLTVDKIIYRTSFYQYGKECTRKISTFEENENDWHIILDDYLNGFFMPVENTIIPVRMEKAMKKIAWISPGCTYPKVKEYKMYAESFKKYIASKK